MSIPQCRSWVEVNLTNYRQNIEKLKKFLPKGTAILQIVKANAYGHGSVAIAKEALKVGASFFGVANCGEGVELRKSGISDVPILVLSPCFDFEIPILKKFNLIPSVSTLDFAKKFSGKVHINLETGMGRGGFDGSLMELEVICALPNIEVEGIYSHLAASEEDFEYTNQQLREFENILSKLSFKPKYVHIANSGGLFSAKSSVTNMVRIGLMSFGGQIGFFDEIDLVPALSFKSRIALIKTAGIGQTIGYNRTYKATSNMAYAVIPVGYADGYNYLLKNKGNALINGKLCPVIGKVSMDMITVDITDVNACVGDEVALLGWQHPKLYPQNVANLYNGSGYEILCAVGRRAQWVYVD